MAKRAKGPRAVPHTRSQHARLIVGISGASGAVYGIRLLEILRASMIETHLVMTRNAELTVAYETNRKVKDVRNLADHSYDPEDMAAAISSGSFLTLGMIVAPCSVKALAEIATGVTGTLLARAADVTLKERRPLVLMVRETPLHSGHLKNMLAVTEMGAIVAPPVPAFYARPANLEAIVDYSVARALDLFGIHLEGIGRWDRDAKRRPGASKGGD